MNKKYFVLGFIFAYACITQTSSCMEKEGAKNLFDKEQEDEIVQETNGAASDINSENRQHKDETFEWKKDVVSTFKEESKYFMWKPDYSTHSVNYDPKADKSFWDKRLRDGDDLISHIIKQGGYTLFEKIALRPIFNIIDELYATEEDILIKEHNKNAQRVSMYGEGMKLILTLLHIKEAQLEQARHPQKKEMLTEKQRRLNKSRKVLDRQHQAWEDKFTDSILKHKDHKAKQPKTVFENNNGELVKVQEPENKNELEKQSSSQEFDNEHEKFLKSMESEPALENQQKLDKMFNQNDKTPATEA